MDKEVLLGVLGFLTAAGAGVRWLMQVYFHQNKTIEDLRHKNEKATIYALKDAIGDLKKELDLHRRSLKEVDHRLQTFTKTATTSLDEQKAVITSMQSFVDTTIKRMVDIETKIIELTYGLVMLKGQNGK